MFFGMFSTLRAFWLSTKKIYILNIFANIFVMFAHGKLPNNRWIAENDFG